MFVGDSPNDAPMFAYFPLSVGVANVRRFADRIATLPAFVTTAESGAGFVEVAERSAGGGRADSSRGTTRQRVILSAAKDRVYSQLRTLRARTSGIATASIR